MTSPARVRLGIVHTGGTIGAVAVIRGESRAAEQGEPEHAIQLVRDVVDALAANLISVSQPVQRFSEDLVPADWVQIAGTIRRDVSEQSLTGVLVLHGTDTMTYTAAALSFLLADLPVPIVLTGANTPPNEKHSDAAKNVHDAIIALQALGPGTYVAFAGAPELPGWVHVGTRVQKAATAGRTFVSSGCRPVAKIVGERFVPIAPAVSPTCSVPISCEMDERVLALRLFPGLDLRALRTWIRAAAIRGLVVELYASATGPMREPTHSLPSFARACKCDGVLVVTTCPPSAVEETPRQVATEYPSFVALRDAGAVFLPNTLTETATVKLMWALAQSSDPVIVRRLMRESIAHEVVV